MGQRKKLQDTRGGLISRGRCENPRCKLDLGNRLDPYCWACATALTQRYEAGRKERLAELRRHAPQPVTPPPATAEQARTQLAEMLRQLGI